MNQKSTYILDILIIQKQTKYSVCLSSSILSYLPCISINITPLWPATMVQIQLLASVDTSLKSTISASVPLKFNKRSSNSVYIHNDSQFLDTNTDDNTLQYDWNTVLKCN